MSKISILLIGGTGTLSYAVLTESLKGDNDVYVFNRGKSRKNLPDGANSLIGDFYDEDSIKKAIQGKTFDVVVDFLSRKPEDIQRVYPLFRKVCKQYIFISTACVFERNASTLPITERSPKPNTDWAYNTLKDSCEKELLNLSSGDDFAYYTIVRPYITYDLRRIPIGITPSYRYNRVIVERIKHGKPMFTWQPDSISTITFNEDFAKGVVGLFLNSKAINEDFNVVSNHTSKTKEILSEIYKQLGVKPNIIEITKDVICKELPNSKPMLIADRFRDAIFDNRKIIDAVPDLKFDTNIEDGISKVLDYYNHLETYEYDYKYEGQIDRLLKKCGIKTTFIAYPGSMQNQRLLYYCYKYLPFRYARKIANMLSLEK